MRIKRWGLLVLLGLLLVATQGLTEPQRGRGRPGGSGGDPGGSPQGGPPSDSRGGRFRSRDGGGGPPGQNPSDGQGRRMRGGDPNGFFDRMANGKDVLIRSEMDERGQAFFDRIAEKLGVTNGQITREQFATYMSQPRESRFGQQPPGPTPPGSSAEPPGRPGGNWADPNNIDSRAEESFRRHDKNGDGVLSHEEMPEELQAHLETFDADRNGLIDLNEYKEYYRARMEQRLADRGFNVQSPGQLPVQPAPAAAPRAVETKPLVYHTDNLPKELPPWFKQLDTNHDAQIGLYEWRVSGRPLSEFLAMDRNNDGFLTVEEVLAYEAKNRPASPRTPSTSPRGGPVLRRTSN